VWEAEPSCENRKALARSVAHIVGREVFSDEPSPDYVVHGRMYADGGEWVVRFRLETAEGDGIGERELRRSTPTCHGLDMPAAVALALMIDLQANTPSSPPPPNRENAPDIPYAAPAVYRLPPQTRLRWAVEGEASLALAAGLFPVTTAGARIDLGLRLSRLRAGANATLWPPVSSAAASGIRMQAWQIGAQACAAAPQRTLWLIDFCLGAQVGVLSAQGIGWLNAETQSPLLLTLDPEIVFRAGKLGPLRAGVAAGALVPLGRYRFYTVTPAGEADAAVLWPLIPTLRLEIGLVSGREGEMP
jgi:hypothetical protein